MSDTFQRSFAGGELASSLLGRADQLHYQNGLSVCRNFVVRRHGGVENRAGTRFISESKDSTKLSRLIRFVFNASQTYVLEFGDLYMRVYKDKALVNVSGVDAFKIAGETLLLGQHVNAKTYDMSTPWDITTASLVDSIATTPALGDARFSSNGKILFSSGSSRRVGVYDLSTAWDLTTAVYRGVYYITGGILSPLVGTFRFRDDGTSIYVIPEFSTDVQQYDMSVPWDIETAVLVGSFSVATEDATPTSASFKYDGSIMFVAGDTTNIVYQYALSVPWSVLSASLTTSFSVATQDVTPVDFCVRSNGIDAYMLGNTTGYVYRYTLGTAWDISTAVITSSYNFALTVLSSIDFIEQPFSVGDLISNGGVNYYCILANLSITPPNATYWYPLTGSIYEIPTTYLEADLDALHYAQSGDVVTITHKDYPVRELSRLSDTGWLLADKVFGPYIPTPTSVVTTKGAVGTKTVTYVVTAIAVDTYEESLASAEASDTLAVDPPTPTAPNVITWVAVSGATQYYVYKKINDIFGFIGVSGGVSFDDIGYAPSVVDIPPAARTPFDSTYKYPQTVSYYQQRILFANTTEKTENIWSSRIGQFNNFSINIPLQLDDAGTYLVAGKQVNAVQHLVDVGVLIVLTTGGEWVAIGDANGTLTPLEPNLRQQGYSGAASVQPVTVSNRILYLQARGNLVRELAFSFQSNAFITKDMTVYSGHLFEEHSVVRMDYQQIPNSIAWCVRSDGVLLALTYLPEQEIWGWHHHDTDGIVEDICVIPDGSEDALYMIVKRTINSVVKRYVEVLESRKILDFREDAFFVDSGVSYDGQNTTATTLTITGGVAWGFGEELTMTASVATFVAADVDNAYRVFDASGVSVVFTVLSYTSNVIVTVSAGSDVPVSLQGVARSTWEKMFKSVSGLSHLEGKTVSVLGDGHVDVQAVVSSGAITLSSPYAVIHVGLPYDSDFETLPLDPQDSEVTLIKQKRARSIGLLVEASRGIFAGPDVLHLKELKQRSSEAYGEAVSVTTGIVEMNIASRFGKEARVFIRQSDPLPLAILSINLDTEIGG